MPGLIFSDRLTFKQGRLCVTEQVDKDGVMVEQVSEVMTTSKTKEAFIQGVNAFLADPEAATDTGWTSIFRVVPSTTFGELFPFRAPSLAGAGSHGIVFRQVGEGGEIEFSKTSLTHKFVPNVKYGTALAYSNEWFEDGQMNLIEMVTQDFRDSANDKLAAIHYAALSAAITAGISVSTSVSGATLNDLINSIQADIVVMRRNRRRPDIALMAPEQEMLYRAAMAVRSGNTQPGTAGTNGDPLSIITASLARLTPLVTEHLSSGGLYTIESKRRLISVNRQELRMESFDDILHGAHTIAGTFRRGVLVAEGQVIRRRTGLASALPTS